MDVLNWDIYIVEQVRVELNCVAAGHEDHDLFLQILSQEGEEKLELACGVNKNVALFKVGDC